MFPGETLATGAAATCSTCSVTPKIKVYSSPGGAGYYLGTYCDCGPYTRESEYFKTRDEAVRALARWDAGDRVGARSSEFNREGAKDLEVIEHADAGEMLKSFIDER